MSWNQIVGRLLRVEELRSIESAEVSFAASWAASGLFWILFYGVVLVLLTAVYYTRYQQRGRRTGRIVLACLRGICLLVLLLILAEPILTVRATNQPRPLLWVLLDATESMDIEDELPPEEQNRLATAVGLESMGRASRADFVQSLLTRRSENLLRRLEENCRVQVFVLEGADRVRQVTATESADEQLDLEAIAAELESPQGPVTALGTALQDLATRHATGHLAGVIAISDFGQNTGLSPLGDRSSPVRKLGVPIYAVGVGPASAVNLAVDLQLRPVMKKAETSSIDVSIRQTGLDGQRAKLTLTTQPVDEQLVANNVTVVAEREIELTGVTMEEEFPITPDDTGQFRFTATVEALPEEVVTQDNTASGVVDIRDDFLRVLFVEHEPTWEWRFIKEVFHRDKLVGMRGFRTYLSSADRSVRRTNELFLDNLTPNRKEFFANDVIFIGDMPASALNDRFCSMVREFVTKFGGGLVVAAGPRFGVGQLADTALADILPVQLDHAAGIRDDRQFQMRLTPLAFQQDFMRLGSPMASADDVQQRWSQMGPLPWYQPVKAPHLFGTTVLAEHPTDKCADGSPQPLIAIRQFERGSVVYLGFNETWRLRRKFGEQYYRQFWGQMLHRLGLRRAMGAQKRFEVRSDQQIYKPDDKVILTVVAYDENFEELKEDKLKDRKLTARLVVPSRSQRDSDIREISLPLLREGVFETQIPVLASGTYQLQVNDPISGETVEHEFDVAQVSVERRTATRNVALQEQIASANPGGKVYDLESVAKLPDELNLKPIAETSVKVFPLWSTWLCFGVVVLLMLSEWTLRKIMNMP